MNSTHATSAMTAPARIYLDNAATSWPKPETVYRAIDHYQRTNGAPAGRSGYREADETARLVDDCRRQVARLVDAPSLERVIFTANGTDGLNLVLLGTLRPGDHVITTVVEHNSVLRPLHYLAATRGVEVSHVRCNAEGVVDPSDVNREVRPSTRMIVLTHVSNVTGAIQPVVEVGQIAERHGVLLCLDAAQSLGHLPVSMTTIGCHYLVASGHKGLLGPLGTGVCVLAPGAEQWLKPTRFGGTGSQSELAVQPEELPQRFESGNLNVLGIAGLRAGVAFLHEIGVVQVQQHDQMLLGCLLPSLRSVPGVHVYGPKDPAQRVGVVSFRITGFDPAEVAAALDTSCRVQVRSGLHCAPRMHEALGTLARGGTVRASFGPFTQPDELEITVAAIKELASLAP